MAGWTRISRGERIILAVLFAVLLLSRAAVPVGYMPVAAPSGIVISVCAGTGPARVFIPLEKDRGQQKHKASGTPCTFAGLAGGLTPPPVFAAILGSPALASARSLHGNVANPALPAAAPPPPATGPPSRT